jgi:hypothetical protein
MRKLSIYFVIVWVLSACQPLKFDRYAGTVQNEIPEKYRGKYEFFNRTLSPDTSTIWIGKNSYTQIDKDHTEIYFLDSINVFSSYKNYDFLSRKDDDKWTSFHVRKKKENILLIPIIVEGKVKNKYSFLKKYFSEVDTIPGKIVAPDKSSYNVKMNEDELVKYVNKIKKQSLTLKKVPF